MLVKRADNEVLDLLVLAALQTKVATSSRDTYQMH